MPLTINLVEDEPRKLPRIKVNKKRKNEKKKNSKEKRNKKGTFEILGLLKMKKKRRKRKYKFKREEK